MSTISRRRRQLKIKENNLKYFLTPKPSREGGTEEAPASSSGSRGKGLSVRGNDKENLECILDVGSKLTAQCKDLFNDKENVSPNIGTTTETHNLKLRQNSKNLIESPKTSSPSTPPDIVFSRESAPVTSQLSADEVTNLLTQEEPGERYYQILAEQRRKALKETLAENEKLTNENKELIERTADLQGQLDSALELVRLYEKIIERSSCSDTDDTPAN